MVLITQTPGLFVGDGKKLFLISRDGSVYDKSFYVDGSSGLDFLNLGILIENRIKWFNEKELIYQTYGKKFYVKSFFKKEGANITIKDWVFNEVFVRKISSSKQFTFVALFKFWPERCEESSCIVKGKSVISFKSSDGLKNVVFSPNFNKIFNALFIFDKTLGYPIHFYPIRFWLNRRFIGYDIKRVAKKFTKKFAINKPVFGKLSPISIGFLRGKNLTIFYLSTNESLDKIENLTKRLSCHPPNRFDDIDERVIRMLTNKDTGLPIAAPEYENPKQPYQSSGGYGYCWIRDAVKELEYFPQLFEKFLKTFMKKKYEEVPQRVWAFDGSVAPGWSNGYLVNQPWNYQLDQLALFVCGLSKHLMRKKKVKKEELSLLIKFCKKLLKRSYSDGMPLICCNCWEDHIGIFSHTAGTYLQAFLRASSCFEKLGVSKLAFLTKKKSKRLSKSVKVFWKGSSFKFYLHFPIDTYYKAKTFDELKRIDYKKGKLINLLDSGTFELIKALSTINFERFADEIISHLKESIPPSLIYKKPFCFEGLWKKTRRIEGLVRYRGDTWRRNPGKHPEKIWSVATLEGVNTLFLISKKLLETGDKDLAKQFSKAGVRLFKVFESKVLLAEQYYDNGKEDSAIALGWSHALRLKIKRMLKTEKLKKLL